MRIVTGFCMICFMMISFAGCQQSKVPQEDETSEHNVQEEIGQNDRQSNTYYIHPEIGDDGNNGQSEAFPWASFEQVNMKTFKPGDKILIHRGTTLRDQLKLSSRGDESNPIIVGVYGDGDLPILNGSIERSFSDDWVEKEKGIWETVEQVPLEVGNILYNHVVTSGMKVWKQEDLKNKDDFYYDPISYKVMVQSPTNPGERFNKIELALTKHIVDFSQSSYVIYENLNVTKGGAHGFFGSDAHHITIKNCEISFIGGGECPGLSEVRYGNGIEFWGGNQDQLVENCYIHDIYDTGLTNQNNSTEQQQERITYQNNVIERCGMYSYELWNNTGGASIVKDIRFSHNTCIDAGGGWGAFRLWKVGFHLNLGWNYASTENVQITNNIFYGGKFLLAEKSVHDATNWWSQVTMDYNLYDTSPTYRDSWPWLITNEGDAYDGYNLVDFKLYQQSLGFDPNSLATHPFFEDEERGDYRLQHFSTAIAGAEDGSDIGAIPFDPSSASMRPAPDNMYADLPQPMPDPEPYEMRLNPIHVSDGSVVEAEDYNEGGLNKGYYDKTPGNTGKFYREDNVDIERCTDEGYGYNIGWTEEEEWWIYDLLVEEGTYNLTARVASDGTIVGDLQVYMDEQLLGSFGVENTGGWQNWTDISLEKVEITEGNHQMKVMVVNGGTLNFNYMRFDLVKDSEGHL